MHISPTSKPVVLITMGDPAGIGPEIIARSMASPGIKGLAIFVVIADSAVMRKALDDEGVVFSAVPAGSEMVVLAEDRVNVVAVPTNSGRIEPGKPTELGARCALECLDAAADIIKTNKEILRKAIVTAPVDKSRISGIYPGFVGHTEYFQELFSAKMITMVLIGEHLRVVPVTRHIPLKDVPGALSVKLIRDTLAQVVDNRCMICGKQDARIGIAALNPHGGEGGKFGGEEVDIIIPAVNEAKKTYPYMVGPIPADTIFYKAMKKELDIVVSMYHDQCLGPFKMVDFASGVNMTLGLGCVRTSPDHGTAFDIAGKGIASSSSMESAIQLAVKAIS